MAVDTFGKVVGDKVWYVTNTIAIYCSITEFDEFGFATIDEPVGHDIDLYDHVFSKEDAASYLLERLAIDSKFLQEADAERDENYTLEQYRESICKFIASTQSSAGVNPRTEGIYTCEWPDCQREDWINISDARKMLKGKCSDA